MGTMGTPSFFGMLVSPAFSPLHSFVGGLMLASSVHNLLGQLGAVLGISGFFHTTVQSLVSSSSSKDTLPAGKHAISPADDEKIQSDRTSRVVARLFTVGLLTGGAIFGAFKLPLEASLGTFLFDPIAPSSWHITKGHGLFTLESVRYLFPAFVTGTLVGVGTKLGSGCTSGHFLCGLSRFSIRSLVATATFFSVAVVTHLSLHPTPTLLRKAATIPTAHSPTVSSLVLLQLPALIYAVLVPVLLQRSDAKTSRPTDTDDEDDEKVQNDQKTIHEQAAKVSAFFIGLHFAFGLGLTGMLRPSKVLGFLSMSPSRMRAGVWDPSLAFVALGGIIPISIGYFTTTKPRIDAVTEEERVGSPKSATEDTSNRPLLYRAAPRWRVPTRRDIDWRLIVGATVFGVGWGATGFCPGPVLVNLGASLLPSPQDGDAMVHLAKNLIFTLSMAAGGFVAAFI